MPEILSQQEIDSLLAGLSAGKTPTEVIEKKKEEKEIVPYEFRRPSRVSKNQIRTIQTIHQNFAESFGYHLISKLQTPVTVQVENVDQLFYSEYILSIEKPSAIFTLSAGDERGEIILEINLELAFVLIEKLLGGGDVETNSKKNFARPLTQIEQSLIKSIVERSAVELEKAWSIIEQFKFKISKYESDPDIVQVAPSSEIVLVISFIISLGNKNYRMSLCYPVFVIEDSLAKMNLQRFMSVRKHSASEYTKFISERIKTTKIPIVAELGQTELTLEEIVNLSAGDVILLNTRVDGQVKIYIAGKLKLYGKPGVFGGRKAVKITRIANNEE